MAHNGQGREHAAALGWAPYRTLGRRRPSLGQEARGKMSDAKVTVFVVDDDLSVRESLKLLIESAGWQPEAFGSAHEFLSRARVPGPSCLLLDVVLPDLNGLDLQSLVADRTGMPIFFIKPLFDDLLVSAIRSAIERSCAALGDEAQMLALRDHYASLSPREREVMGLVVCGRLNKQVGAELGISEITVKAHRGSMMRKMKAGCLPQLVLMAARLCLTPVLKS